MAGVSETSTQSPYHVQAPVSMTHDHRVAVGDQVLLIEDRVVGVEVGLGYSSESIGGGGVRDEPPIKKEKFSGTLREVASAWAMGWVAEG
mmetsp:Transcript_56574/g.112338  ORF Transcript_56574/g.112338 Transcript_56574/m.112338 type:complete len:90 (+) Transcript_56574:1155-1424(+)